MIHQNNTKKQQYLKVSRIGPSNGSEGSEDPDKHRWKQSRNPCVFPTRSLQNEKGLVSQVIGSITKVIDPMNKV